MEQIQEQNITLPQLNKPAPNFTAKTTHGVKTLSAFAALSFCAISF